MILEKGSAKGAVMDTKTAGEPDQGTAIHIAASGRAGEMWGLAFRIFFLNIVTATIYRFWGTTAVRRYIWSHTTINGEPLEYRGKGSELLFGFLIVVLFIFAPLFGAFFAIQAFFPPTSPVFGLAMLALYLILFFLFGLAIYRALRYRLSRTAWRGIRFGLNGSAATFAAKFLGLLILNGMTLGWMTPVLDMFVMRRLSSNAVFGRTPFQFDGSAGRLYGPFAVTYILSIIGFVALGIVMFGILRPLFEGLTPEDMQKPDFILKVVPAYLIFFGGAIVLSVIVGSIYSAARLHAWAESMRFERLTFTTNITYGGLVGLIVTNALLIVFTLGIATPIAHMRGFKFILANVKAHGTVDLAKIEQAEKGTPRFGEGLADAFDIGGI